MPCRRVALAALLLGLALPGLLAVPAGPALAVEQTSAPATHAPQGRAEPRDDVLERAQHALRGPRARRLPDPTDGAAGAEAGDRADASLALRDVFLARPTLDVTGAREARSLLARPTDRRRDPYDDGYRAPSRRICGEHVCVHHVERTADAPPSRRWAATTLRVMERVWQREVVEMGYRPPPSDGRRGGDGRFDVYLSDLGANGLFGYCAPEQRAADRRRAAAAFCVLDNDFAREQFRARPRASLQVTAAHEFFHAVQLGYDFREDPWLMESTATWMEEQVVDGANDNRRYLRYGQLGRPGLPLDRFDPAGYAQYGNWAFWQFLSERHGVDVVREVWQRAAPSSERAGGRHSVGALKATLARRGGLAHAYADFASAATRPRRAFAEGAAWPAAAPRATRRLAADRRTTSTSLRVDHLASASVALHPRRSLSPGSRVVVQVRAPRRGVARARVAVELRSGAVRVRDVALDGRRGQVRVRFGHGRVERVVVTVVNASTRYTCAQATTYACGGRPLDEQRRFEVRAVAVPGVGLPVAPGVTRTR